MEIATNNYNFWEIILSSASLIFTIIGLIFVFIQIRKLKHSIWNTTHAALFSQSLELLKFLNEKSLSYQYFYENKELPKEAEEKVYILYAAKALANFLEQLLLQKDNLPKQQWRVWKKYIGSSLQCSQVLQDFILEKKEWYSKELLDEVMIHSRI